jgi:hypothetical protein
MYEVCMSFPSCRRSGLAIGLLLLNLLATGVPALAAKKFINRSPYLICLVPEPKVPGSDLITVTPGPGCEVRDPVDPEETATLREETKASGGTNAPIAPIALKPLFQNRNERLLYLNPAGSVSFSATAGAPLKPGEGHELGFRVCTASLAAAGGMVLQDEYLSMAFGIKPSLDGDLFESLTCTRFRPTGVRPTGVRPTGVRPTGVRPTGVRPTGVRPTGAKASWSGHAFDFQTPDTDDPDLRLVGQVEPSECSIQ